MPVASILEQEMIWVGIITRPLTAIPNRTIAARAVFSAIFAISPLGVSPYSIVAPKQFASFVASAAYQPPPEWNVLNQALFSDYRLIVSGFTGNPAVTFNAQAGNVLSVPVSKNLYSLIKAILQAGVDIAALNTYVRSIAFTSTNPPNLAGIQQQVATALALINTLIYYAP